MERHIEPLEPGAWFDEIAKVNDARSATGYSVSALLRRVFFLVCLTPAPIRGLVNSQVTEATLEHWLEIDATASAAFALIAPPTRLSILRNAASDEFEVQVQLFGASAFGSDSDRDISVALLGAWCRAVLLISQGVEELALDESAIAGAEQAKSITSLH